MSLDPVGVFYNQSSWTINDEEIYLNIGGQETKKSAIVNIKERTVQKGQYSYKEAKM